MNLNIPEEEREALKTLLVDGDDNHPLLRALKTVAPTLHRRALVKNLAASMTGSSDFIDVALVALFNISRTIDAITEGEVTISHDDVFTAVAGSDATPEQRERFDKRLTELLSIRTLRITQKAMEILADNPNLFSSARTLSELRPVFLGEPPKPEALVVLHQLKLVYHSGPRRERKDLFIALDGQDLLTLKKIIDRALLKHEELNNAVSSPGLQLLKEET